ncbi:MAG TPA: toll/interleukin-1 receptor domain-containing protein [Anaerolineales bacterium]|nr:toll/interleukin-1 receptor domain-containing protein [Anaerolineales bacterium]HNE03449.1 toll/interleukin-1 receptor domain-containing protein [Anaerolineales bacterium]
MKTSLMISYSRRQTPFVDRLYEELQKDGYSSIWLDYQSLTPAQPWYQQILDGITGAETLLLVVSKDSIESKNVEPEWRLALEHKKRIVLVIFEAYPLPVELQGCEWVDFRLNHKASLQKLSNMLGMPPQPVTFPAPQSGFKAPKRFWLAIALSVIVLLSSLPSWWTLIIPFILIPLPWQIYKRDYSFSRVIPTLTVLFPLFQIISVNWFFEEGSALSFLRDIINLDWLPVVGVLAGWLLVGLLLTPVMQRRATPVAARVRFANPLVADIKKPQPVVFAIDHAPEDGRYANALRRTLEKYGHRSIEPGETPQAVLVLISAFKKTTEYDLDTVAVYPILLQAVTDIDRKLQRIQWIDFRKGMGSADKLAKLLPEPQKLLKVLAVAPTGSQEIFPLAVNALQYFYLIAGVFGGGGLLISTLSFASLIASGVFGIEYISQIFVAILNGAFLFLVAFSAVRGLRTRLGGSLALYPLLILMGFVYLINFANFSALFVDSNSEETSQLAFTAVNGAGFALWFLPMGTFLIIPFLLFGWQGLYRWIPLRQTDNVTSLESIFLFYAPRKKGRLVFHILFHLLLAVIVIAAMQLDSGEILTDLLVVVMMAVFFRWLARRNLK